MERFLFNKQEKGSAANEEGHNDALHSADLFDEDNDAAGERIDQATGKPIDNSTATETEGLSERTEDDIESSDENVDDAAARWLRENDPEQQ